MRTDNKFSLLEMLQQREQVNYIKLKPSNKILYARKH